ncbi:MAG TPA: c-type cytochrome [Sphingomonadaceae bacterium]|nr:c-type cytochrome [Sphingomonadaceae bacterium]
MSRFLGTACIIALTATLAGCGGQKTQDQTSNRTTEASAPASEPAENAAANVSEAATNLTATASAAGAAVAAPPEFAPCKACHSATPGQNGIGPSLAGVFGTKAAEVANYNFSDAMKSSGLTWDEATLDRYLTSPRQVVPGTKMTFPGIKDAAKRTAVIAYLKAIK